MTTEAEARRAIRHHTAAIDRGSKKAEDHRKAIAAYLRQFPNIKPVVPFRDERAAANKVFQRAERARINRYKQTGVIDP